MITKRTLFISCVFTFIVSATISIISSIIISNSIVNNNKNKEISNDIKEENEELSDIDILSGGWKSKDDTFSLLFCDSGGEKLTSNYIIINNDYVYWNYRKQNFEMIDDSHIRLGESTLYYHINDENNIIIGSGEYIRVNDLKESDFDCSGDCNCVLYDK